MYIYLIIKMTYMACFAYSGYKSNYMALITPKGSLKHLQPILARSSVCPFWGLPATPFLCLIWEPPGQNLSDFQMFKNKITGEPDQNLLPEADKGVAVGD